MPLLQRLLPMSDSSSVLSETSLPVLSLGDRGEAVTQLRQLLAKCDRNFGVEGILVSDVFDIQLEAIVRVFQYQVFLFQDGTVGTKTWQALQADTPIDMPVLKLGQHGKAVRQVQTRLKQYGDYADALDGIFNRRTEQAVITFQVEKNILAEGVVNAVTWHQLSQD